MQNLHAAASGQLFISAKTSTAIPAKHQLVRDALVAASLDPAVRSIDYIASARVSEASVKLCAIVIIRDDGRYVLDVLEARPLRDIDAEGLAQIALRDLGLLPLTLSQADIRREPRFTNAKLVWAHRMHPVGFAMRMRVLSVLQEDGPMRLACLLSSIPADRDPSPAILAMACSDLVVLDLVTRPLGPRTIVRARA
jgi:hypothetical protein